MIKTEYNFPDTQRHIYDIDVFEILDALRKKLSSNLESVPEHLRDLKFIDYEEELFINRMKESGIDLTENIQYRNYILPSSFELYNSYLGWKIITMDPYKIGPLLSYQSVIFLGNDSAPKDNFLGLVEFLTYNFVKSTIYFNEYNRLDKMVDWIERNRIFQLDKAYNANEKFDNVFEPENVEPIDEQTKAENVIIPDLPTKDSTPLEIIETVENNETKIVKKETDDIPKNRTVTMESSAFAQIFVEKLNPYFPNEQGNSFYELIFNDTKPNLLLCFNGTNIELCDLFKRLRQNRKIIVDNNKNLARWIVDNFCIKNIKNDESISPLKYDVVLDYLVRDSRIPKGVVRVLFEEIAPYITKEERKARQK